MGAKIKTKKSRQNKLGNSSEHEEKKKTLLIILERSLNVILDEKEATKEEELSKTLLWVKKSISYEIFI